MNQLSWMLYLADVVSNVGWLLAFIGVLQAGGAVFLWIRYIFALEDHSREAKYIYDADEKAAYEKTRPKPKWAPIVTMTVVLWWIAAAACPSRETLYAIAASEMGEKFLHTTTGGKVQKALEAWLDHQIAEQDKTEPSK